MNGNGQNRSEQNKGSPLFYLLFTLSTILLVVIILMVCFIPAVVSSISFRLARKRMPSSGGNHEHWVTFWAVIAQLSLYVGGGLFFHNTAFVDGKIQIDNIVPRMIQYSSWQPLYLCFLFIFLPAMIFYLIKLGDLFKDNTAFDKAHEAPSTSKILSLNLISAFGFPLNFVWFGFRAKKITWLVAACAYAVVPLTMLIVISNGIDPKSHLAKFTVLAQVLMWLISLVHTNRIKKEYFARLSDSKNTHEQQDQDQTRAKSESDVNWKSTDPFMVLGVATDASETEIKKSYRDLMAQYHPDKVSNLGLEFQKLADEKCKILNIAYQECLKKKAA